jgi:hypothetical protein
VNDGTFHHLALVRHNSVMTWYFNGSVLGTVNTPPSLNHDGNPLVIGGLSTTSHASQTSPHAYFDEIRISKGIARWTTDFSNDLPTQPYP